MILIEELHETPMVVTSLKPFHLEVANWSKNVSFFFWVQGEILTLLLACCLCPAFDLHQLF